MRRISGPLLPLILCGLLAVPVAARGGRKADAPPLADRVEELVGKLGGPSYRAREEATLALIDLGEEAVPALEAFADHPDPETRRRVLRVLLHFREQERRRLAGLPRPGDWPSLKRDPGRAASSGERALREVPSVRWFLELPEAVGLPYFDSPLLAAGDLLFVVTRSGHVFAVRCPSGELAYRTSTGEPVLASPVLAAGTIYVPGRSLVALEAATGRVRWKWETDYGVPAPPLVHEGLVYAVEKGEKLVALDPADGAVRWHVRLDATTSAPVVVGDRLVVGTREGLSGYRATDGSRRWSFGTEAPVTSSPAVIGNLVVVGDASRNVYAVDAERGDLVWRRCIPEGSLLVTPAVYGDTIVFGTSGATVRAMGAGRGEDRWTRWVGSIFQSSPCIAGGIAYFTAGPTLYAYECVQGDDVWRVTTAGLRSAPILVDGVLYEVTLDGVVVAWE